VKEDATEKVDLDINIIAFDADGEVLAKVNYASKEAPGLNLGKDQFRVNAAVLKAKPLEFEVFEEATISLPDLPEGTDSLVFACTNYTDTGFDVLEKVRCRVVDVTVGCVERDLAVFVVDTSRASALSAELCVQKTGIIVAKLSLDVAGGTPLIEVRLLYIS
jgi:stress response protein SCP2